VVPPALDEAPGEETHPLASSVNAAKDDECLHIEPTIASALRLRYFLGMLRPLVVSLALLGLASSSHAEERRVLESQVAAPADAPLLNRLPGSTVLRLSIGLQLRNRSELDELLRDLYDPQSPRFRRFLTVEQFTERFGPTEEDDAAVASFVERHGLAVRRTAPNRLVLDVAGPVENVERAFDVELGIYQHPTEDRTFFAPNAEPSVESGLPILSVVGLTDRVRPHPMSARREGRWGATRFAGSGPGGVYLGSDMRSAYAPGVALDGTGQAVGLFELGPYNLVDIHDYFSSLGQPLAVPIVDVLLDGTDGGVPDGGDDGEVALDIEQAISLAPNLSSLIVYESDTSELDIWNQMATDDVAKQLSSSWAYGVPDLSDNQVFLEFAAQGQNLFQASGDNGAYSASMRMAFPTDNPNLVSVGGTHLSLASDGGWESEVAWTNSGGGVSTNHIAIPSYQVGVANATNQASFALRSVPDVCAEADFDNYVCSNGGCAGGWGGTSFAAPRWAGFLALVNEQANGTEVGFLNPSVYALGEGPSYGSVLHDITMGNDFNKASPNLFSAVTGYDLVTGWGSPNGQDLIDALAPNPAGPNFTLAATPSLSNAAPGENASFTIALEPTDGFSDVVDLKATIVGIVPGATAVLSAASLPGTGSVNLAVSTTSATPAGTFQVVVVGTSTSSGASGALTHAAYVTIGPESFFLRVPREVFVNQASNASLSFAVNPVNGFQGQVALRADADLPVGVSAALNTSETNPSDPPVQLGFAATRNAGTGLFLVTLTGDAPNGDAGLTDVEQTILGVSAATGDGGAGLPLDLSAAYNKVHIATDGTPFSQNKELANDGYAYSANLLTPARIFDGVQFVFGPPNELDAVSGGGQSLPLPPGSFTGLWLLAAAINGAQPSQNLILEYTDRTGVVFTQTFSDWDFPGASDGGELEAVAMPYRTIGNGTLDASHIQNLYAYRFPVDQSKTLASLILPENSNLIVHAITLVGPGATEDAVIDAPGDAGAVASAPRRGCGCAEGPGDASLLGLALLLAARLRWRH